MHPVNGDRLTAEVTLTSAGEAPYQQCPRQSCLLALNTAHKSTGGVKIPIILVIIMSGCEVFISSPLLFCGRSVAFKDVTVS